MLNQSRILSTFYLLLRLFGFFPFTWKPETTTSEGSSVCITKLHIRESKAWSVWSLCITVFTAVAMVIDAYYAVAFPRGKVLGFQTMLVAQMIFDVVTAFCTTLLQVILWSQRGQVACFLKFTEVLQLKITFGNKLTVIIFLIALVGLPANAVLMIMALKVESHSLALCTMTIKTFWSSLLMMFIAIIYHNMMQFIGLNLEALFLPIKKAYEDAAQLDEHTKLTEKRQSIGDAPKKITITSIYTNKITNFVHQPMITSSDVCKPCTVWQGTAIEDLSENVLNLFHLNKMINAYAGSPLTITMTNLVIWLLTSLFYATLWNTLTPDLRALSLINLIGSLAPVLYLLNSTECVKAKLMEILWILTFLINHRSHKEVKEKLEQLKSLLEYCPGFNVMGIFNMARARSVDIFSFVATYIVILLQFSQNE
ncbi:7TM chemoreceptor [Trinorchestia longiramus]|nr:7TM chemoreceptor [Trinorchestia longiramus]